MTATIDTHEWITCEHGQYRIEKTRWGTYRSFDKDGNPLVIGPTKEAIQLMTPFHMLAHTPEYDGRHDYVINSRTNFVEL